MKNSFNSYDELFNDFGLVLELKYMPRILETVESSNLFYDQMTKVRNSGASYQQQTEFLKQFLSEHFKRVNQEAYIFYTLKSIREERLEDKCPQTLERCKQYLKDSQFTHYEPGLTDDRRDVEIKRITPSILIGKKENIDNSKMNERWERIKKDFTPTSFFNANSVTEMDDYCKDEFLRTYIRRLNFIRVIEHFKELSVDEKLNYLQGNDYEEFSKLASTCVRKLNPELEDEVVLVYQCIPEYMQKFPESFDIDTMLMITAFKANDYLENHVLTEEQNWKYALLLKTCRDNVKSKSKQAIGIKDSLENKSDVPYTYKSLQEACKRISSNGHYVSSLERDLIESSIYENPASIVERDPDIIQVLHLSNEDFEYLLTAEGTVGYLMENKLLPKTILKKHFEEGKISQRDLVDLLNRGLISQQEVKQYIPNLDTIDNHTFETFNEKGILTSDDKLNLFISGKLQFEQIDSLSDEERSEIANILGAERLVELYKAKDHDEATSSEYIRYVQIFRNLVLKGKSKEERKELDEQILEEFGYELEDEILEDLYKSHLITFQTLRDWSGPRIISNMMEKTEIRPEDIKSMCDNGEFKTLFEVLRNPNIPRSKKMGIFRTSFANIDYDSMDTEKRDMLQAARDKCLQLINFKDIKSVSLEKDDESKQRETNGEGKRFNEYTSDPQLRWDLIDLMGQYSYEILDQGLAIFKFPEYKGGTIVLEKMYRKNKPEYGRATKIINMTIEEFERIKKDLILNGDIPPFMVDSHPAVQGRLTNLTHSTAWGQQFADYFEYNLENERTPEEIGKIDKKIKSILNSRELR